MMIPTRGRPGPIQSHIVASIPGSRTPVRLITIHRSPQIEGRLQSRARCACRALRALIPSLARQRRFTVNPAPWSLTPLAGHPCTGANRIERIGATVSIGRWERLAPIPIDWTLVALQLTIQQVHGRPKPTSLFRRVPSRRAPSPLKCVLRRRPIQTDLTRARTSIRARRWSPPGRQSVRPGTKAPCLPTNRSQWSTPSCSVLLQRARAVPRTCPAPQAAPQPGIRTRALCTPTAMWRLEITIPCTTLKLGRLMNRAGTHTTHTHTARIRPTPTHMASRRHRSTRSTRSQRRLIIAC